MSDETPYKKQIEQAMTTIFTCRSIIRFNSGLNEAQKQELLAEIDTTLQFVQSRLIAHVLDENKAPDPTTDKENTQTHAKISFEETIKSQQKEQDQRALQALYTLYHVYLGNAQPQGESGLSTFMTRFNDIMFIIKGIHESKDYLSSPYPTAIDDSLLRIKGYIAELYYIFMEFIRAISTILEINDAHIDTDELPRSQKQPVAQDTSSLAINEVIRLQHIYEAHQQMIKARGGIANRVSDVTVLVAYLKESFGWELKQHDDLATRLNTIPLLLNDLTGLLSEYESVIGSLLKKRE